jgi:hypothetical protein
VEFAADVREDPDDIWILGAGIAVEEAVEFLAMSM